ncbi:Pre-mRNA-splicing factor 3 [Dillenia turbinata]|uniref:Pre-mRNA-splicing factor 3 n=1 Tax=Dillenia turbinata TaxID=194707 RepID=A0AAN8VSP5_9MAGN
MDRVSEKERSRKTRDDKDRDRDREHKHRTKDHHHRSSKETDEDSHRRHHHRDDKRDRKSREYSEEREGSRERERERDSKLERSYEREGSRDRVSREESVERQHLSHSHKRKEREVSQDRSNGGEKRVRVSEERRERRRFEDKVKEDDGKDVNVGVSKEERRETRKFEDGEGKDSDDKQERRAGRKFEDRVEEDDHGPTSNGSGSAQIGVNAGPLNMASNSVPQTSLAIGHPAPPKVSSITTTNENKGVSITRSHEVPGKSSTDGSTSAAGKSGSLSLDALAKAKKALQMQKELAEKLKKIPLLNKGASTSSDGSPSVGPKEGTKPNSLGCSKLPLPVSSTATVTASMQAKPSATILPAAAASVKPSMGGIAGLAGLTNIPNIEAVKRAQELAAKMGFHQDPEFAPLINMFPGQLTTDLAIQQKPSKAPVLRLDALGREVDEHGNVINMPKLNNLSTLKVNINKQKKDAFQILKPELEVDPESNPHFDARMGINKDKLLRPKRMSFQFVEEGKWSRDAEIIKLKSQFGEAQAKELKAKQAQLAKAKAEPDINPNLIEVSERVVIKEKPKDPIPDVEDNPFLHSSEYGYIIDGMISEEKLKMEKVTIYVEHPLPIEPPVEPAPPPPQPLKLTKKEQKKLRTQRRLAREKDRQEMIRQGLIEPPKPKVKMSNLMKVLGSEATQDPTRLEMEIRTAAAEREQAHVDRNIARKLTPAERREKKERKLFDDPNTLETIVSVYKINDLSHPQTRFKVDVNAQENRLTGCAVISDGISVVVVEGGTKAIKRYGKLMLRRINWAAAVENEDEEGDEKEDKPMNKCSLVWQGSVAKPSFNRFSVHQCRTEAAARKVFADAGVVHYWDLSVNFTDGQV